MSESDAAEDFRSQAVTAENSAESARKDLDVMLGTWVSDCIGANRGDTGVSQLRLPLDPQLWIVVKAGRGHPHNLSD